MTEREFAVDAVRTLQQAGFRALWAGGCVRDELLGLVPQDYDVATDARPDDIVEPSFADEASREARGRELLERLREEYPRTAAAEVAAVQLGRLRLEAGDEAGARELWEGFLDDHEDHLLAGGVRVSLLDLDRRSGKAEQVATQLQAWLDAQDKPLPEDVLLYDTGHIPGAVKVDWHLELNDQVSRDYLDPAAFAALCAAKGIGRDDTIVFYGDNFNWWAAYALWVFTLFGHEDVRLLDGGRDKWIAEGRPITTEPPTVVPVEYPVVERDDSTVRAFKEDVLAHLGSPLIDVRSPEEYSGERTSAPAERLYGEELGSNYQGQVTMLSKHFEEQFAGGGAG